MERGFSAVLSELRRERKLSQRRLSADLNISQALLSHYENGSREPGLAFVKRACRYFGVSADFLLGISAEKGDDNKCGLLSFAELSGLLENSGDEAVKNAAAAYMEAAARRMAGLMAREGDAVFLARMACEMTKAELSLISALSAPEEGGDEK